MLKKRKLIRNNPDELAGLRVPTAEDVQLRRELIEVRVTRDGRVSRNRMIFHIRGFDTHSAGYLMLKLGVGGKVKSAAGREDHSLVKLLANKLAFPSKGYMEIYLVKDK